MKNRSPEHATGSGVLFSKAVSQRERLSLVLDRVELFRVTRRSRFGT